MAQFSKRKSHAEHVADKTRRLRNAGVKIAPPKASRTDHVRVGEAWRETGKHKGPNATAWKGAKGKAKLVRGPRSPKA